MSQLGDITAAFAKFSRGADSSQLASGSADRMKFRTDLGANPGRLEMYSYSPAGLGRNAPLVVALHGCGQTASEYASGAGWLDLADRLSFAVLAPQQTSANNPNRCFNWFNPRDIHRGEGEAASIAGAITHLVGAEALDPERVFITGLSAGGAMTMAMLAVYPELFAAGAVVAGLPYGVANDMMQAMTAMRKARSRSAAELGRLIPANGGRYPRLIVWHGDADSVVSPGNAGAIVKQWAGAQGLPEDPTQMISDARGVRSLWREPGSDKIAIELNLLRGLGHGVPLSTTGACGIGRIAPFMLEAGVSSTLEIAEFWGLAGERPAGQIVRTKPAPQAPAATTDMTDRPRERGDIGQPQGRGLGEQVLASVNDHVSPGVRDVIAKALKNAGLLK